MTPGSSRRALFCRALSRLWRTALLSAALIAVGRSANPPPTQLFYVPFPEDQQLAAFDAINAAANDPITVFVTLAAATDGTVIFYDHWEDGYEREITNPVQSTTQVFGDGNPSNGYPPGNPADLIPAGTVFNLRNFVATSTLQAVVDYDGRDKIAAFKPISVTKTSIPAATNTLLAGCVEVFERGLWGTEYRSPVGVDMPTNGTTPSTTLAVDENLFSYAAFAISAGPGGATVQVDKDNAGGFEETVTLAEGETIFRSGVNVGGRILANRPVQAVLFTGTVGSSYASRDTSLLPVNRWSSDYYAPVTTPVGDGTVTFLYNPGTAPITVSYDYRNSATSYVTGTISVPAGGNARVNMLPKGAGHSGAYRFYTTGGENFYAMSAIDADATTGNNQAWDGGFTLVGRPSLTTQVLLSLGIGRDPYSTELPNENGNPLWITTSGSGHAATRVYVDFNGDATGPLTDPNGNSYDVHHDLRPLEQLTILDPDGDQSGMLVYTLNPDVRIAAAWAQDPALAAAAQPGIDVASLVPPMREGDAGKISNLVVDLGGDGFVSPGDTLEYDLRGVSNARTNIPGPFLVQDDLSADTAYIPGSARYRFMVNGSWQAWSPIPDNGVGTPFPLDGAGFAVPGTLFSSQQFQVTFRAVVDNRAGLGTASVENTGLIEISPYGLVLPIRWVDPVYGSVGDRIWADANGDGIQDPGEPGIPGVDVYVDLNANGARDPGEPSDVTDLAGRYVLGGLNAGTYTVRVDPLDISAANVGYGPTYDLDGNATAHVAVVTLGSMEDRVDVDFGYRVGASLGDRVWADLNGNGAQDATEVGLNGVRVYLDLNGNDAPDPGEPFAITSGNGFHAIGNLDPGTYTVRIDPGTLPAGAIQSFDLNGALDHEATVTLVGAEHRADLDFGYRGSASIGDLVWDDAVANGTPLVDIRNGRIDLNDTNSVSTSDDGFIGGVRIIDGYVDLDNDNAITTADAGTFQGFTVIAGGLDSNLNGGIDNNDDSNLAIVAESGIPNVRVYLDANGNGGFDPGEISTLTNASGIYTLQNLFDGTHIVRVDPSTLPAGYGQTYDLTAPTNDDRATVLLAGVSRTDVDFGYRKLASLGDLVWNDRDGDGIVDPGEPGIEGVIVYIDSDNDNIFDQGIERYAITGVNGQYLIEDLAAGTYTIRVDLSTIPQGAIQTYDLGGVLDHEASRTLTATEDATNLDFGYRAAAGFGDSVWNDLDVDGIRDPGESGIGGVRVYLDANGNGSFDAGTEPFGLTDATGAYLIGNLVPGTFTARVDPSTLPVGLTQTFDALGELDHSATFSLSGQQVRTEIDFGYTSQAALGDLVWNDLDGDGRKDASEPGLEGVKVTLFRALDDTVAASMTTGADGSYAFSGLMPGTYYLVFGPRAGFERTTADQGDDLLDSDANTSTGRSANVVLLGGQMDPSVDAGYHQPAILRGRVRVDTDDDGLGDAGLAGVTLTLYSDPNGDGNPADGAVVGAPVVTDGDGMYQFTGLVPGSYVVVQTQPDRYLTVSDGDSTMPGDDAANASLTDNAVPVTVLGDETDDGNDFLEEPDLCAETWAEWLLLHPGENAGGNPDGDVLDNLGEFSFAQPYDSGAGDPFCIAASTAVPGTLEGVFVRPKQATDDITYVLEYAAVLGSPTVWQSVPLQAGDLQIVDLGDCHERVTILDLEDLTGLVAGSGFVRPRADLDANDDLVIEHASHTAVEGWKETSTSPGCRSYNHPFLRCAVFTGTISAAGGSVLDLSASAGGADLATLLSPGTAYYAEIVSGEDEGHRFDVVSASAATVTVAADSAPASLEPPFNTRTGALSADLAGDGIVIRPHRTVGEMFPPAAFTAAASQSSADQLQVGSAGQWTIYWLYDDAGSARWVKDVSLVDAGASVLPPGQGMFFNRRGPAGTLQAIGEVRPNDFIRPLAAGASLVGGGHPVDQSATGPNGRAMTRAQGFLGSRNFKTADRFLLWKGDAPVPGRGYDSYFLLDGAPIQPTLIQWTRVADTGLQAQGAAVLFLSNRSAFIEVAADHFNYTVPAPWTP